MEMVFEETLWEQRQGSWMELWVNLLKMGKIIKWTWRSTLQVPYQTTVPNMILALLSSFRIPFNIGKTWEKHQETEKNWEMGIGDGLPRPINHQLVELEIKITFFLIDKEKKTFSILFWFNYHFFSPLQQKSY